ncbi:MAG: serine hydrolase [Mucilaginibacter sp.]
MKKILSAILVSYLLWPVTSIAQTNYPAAISKYMEAQATIKQFSGNVLVAVNGNVIYQKAFGYADREWNVPNSLSSKFEIGSLTKQFTAAAILQLAEQHKLNLNDKLSVYFPGYPKGDSVTLHMLLNHTSGIADYTALPRFNAVHTLALTRDSVIVLFKNQPYAFSPGTKWQYSNSGYFLLGCIIEKVSKKHYNDYIKENILSKASLANTGVNHLDSVLLYRAKGYSPEKSGIKNADYFSMEIPFSAGSIISTVHDLYNWQKALLNGLVISKESVLKMTTAYLGNYGYGLNIDQFNNHKRISHSGAIPGFSSFLGSFPDDKIFIVILSNNEGDVGGISEALSSILFNLPYQIPYIPTEVTINPAVLKKYIGKYQIEQSSGNTYLALVEDNNKLYLKPEGAGDLKMELKPESETKFFFARDHDQEIEFTLDKKGNIAKTYFINKGAKIEIKPRN